MSVAAARNIGHGSAVKKGDLAHANRPTQSLQTHLERIAP
jgi:hypothetical protein